MLTPLAERVGAVNTFWSRAAARCVGDNTDVGGFDAVIAALLGDAPRERAIALIGAGGAAAAVLAAVERWPGARVRVYNRTHERARTLCANAFASVAQPVDDVARGRAAGRDLVVNATSIGLSR